MGSTCNINIDFRCSNTDVEYFLGGKMEAWVIKRKDGKYFNSYPHVDEFEWSKYWAYFFRKKKDASFDIDICNLQDCKPVKVRIDKYL